MIKYIFEVSLYVILLLEFNYRRYIQLACVVKCVVPEGTFQRFTVVLQTYRPVALNITT